MAVAKSHRNPRTHFTDELYGITISKKLGRVLVKLHYIDEQGASKFVSPTWNFHSEEGKQSALRIAKLERDRLLSLPQFQAYIARQYSDVSGHKKLHTKPFTTRKNSSIPNLNGLYAEVKKMKARSDGRPMYYLFITAHGPLPNGKTKYASRSVNKYGLHGALLEAVKWRAKHVGGALPDPLELAEAEAAVRASYAPFLGGSND